MRPNNRNHPFDNIFRNLSDSLNLNNENMQRNLNNFNSFFQNNLNTNRNRQPQSNPNINPNQRTQNFTKNKTKSSDNMNQPQPNPLFQKTKPLEKSIIKAEKLNEEAKIKFRQSQYDEAIKLYEEAFRHNNNSKYLVNMAKCYYKQQQTVISVELMNMALKLSPNDDNLQRLAAIFAFEEFKKFEDPKMLYYCEELMRNALDINSTELNLHNYFLVRKIIFLIKENQRFLEKNELIYFFESKNFDGDKIKSNFMKPTYFDSKLSYPEFITCSITLEIIKDPVTTPCGYTYEKKDFEEWCSKVGCKDVMTNRTFDSLDRLAKNKKLYKFIEKYLKKHQWAVDTGQWGDDWKLYQFK